MDTQQFNRLIQQLKDNRCVAFDASEDCLTKEQISTLIETLQTSTSLQLLNLRSNHIGYRNAEKLATVLKNHPSLEILDLETNAIGDRGAIALAWLLRTSTCLQLLNLENNDIRAQGAKYLAEALEVNISLHELILRNNKIGNQGTKYLAYALQYNTSLHTLRLTYNNISNRGATHLADALTINHHHVITLSLFGNAIGMKGINALSNTLDTNPNLISLHGINNSPLQEKIQKNKNAAKELAELALRGNRFSAQQIRDIIERKAAILTILQKSQNPNTAQAIRNIQTIENAILLIVLDSSSSLSRLELLPSEILEKVTQFTGQALAANPNNAIQLVRSRTWKIRITAEKILDTIEKNLEPTRQFTPAELHFIDAFYGVIGRLIQERMSKKIYTIEQSTEFLCFVNKTACSMQKTGNTQQRKEDTWTQKTRITEPSHRNSHCAIL